MKKNEEKAGERKTRDTHLGRDDERGVEEALRHKNFRGRSCGLHVLIQPNAILDGGVEHPVEEAQTKRRVLCQRHAFNLRPAP